MKWLIGAFIAALLGLILFVGVLEPTFGILDLWMPESYDTDRFYSGMKLVPGMMLVFLATVLAAMVARVRSM